MYLKFAQSMMEKWNSSVRLVTRLCFFCHCFLNVGSQYPCCFFDIIVCIFLIITPLWFLKKNVGGPVSVTLDVFPYNP